MSETKIEMKIDEEIKPLKDLCEKVTKIVCAEFDKNSEQIDTHEMYEVADIIKDLSEAKKNTVEACYKKYILGVMEKNEDDYGETWDEDGAWDEQGRRYYRGQPRDSKGRYMSRRGSGSRRGYDGKMPDYQMDMDIYENYDPKYLREKDKKLGRLYYSEPMHDKSFSELFVEDKEKNADATVTMKNLENYMNKVQKELLDMQGYMSQTEKTFTKQRLNSWLPKF